MKNRMLFMLTITIFNASFTMEYMKNLFGFNSKKQPTELEKFGTQIKELAHIKKTLVSTINATFEAYVKNQKRMSFDNGFAFFGGSGVGDHSKDINVQGITFDLTEEEEGVMHFTITNMLDKSTLIGEFTLNKKIYDNISGNLIYSHLLDVFDAIIYKLDNAREGGFIRYLSDPKTSEKHSETVANLKPQPIEKSESLEKAIERLFKVISEKGKLILERVEQIQGKKESSDNQN